MQNNYLVTPVSEHLQQDFRSNKEVSTAFGGNQNR